MGTRYFFTPHCPAACGRISPSQALIFLLTLLAAGCSSVPDASFVHQDYVAQRTEFKNAYGPVSERMALALTENLKKQNGGSDILERQLAIEQAVVGSPLVLQNRITLLKDGPATYGAMFAAMRAARSTINVEFYIIGDDPVGHEFADILMERAKAGVKINVIYDSLGSMKTKAAFFEPLRQAGVQVVEFNPLKSLKAVTPWKLNHRDHRKQVIVDGRVLFMGGINIDNVYSSAPGSSGGGSSGSSGGSSVGSGSNKEEEKKGGWRDTDVQIEGPAVAEFQKLFLQTWAKQKGPALAEADYLPTIPPAGKEVVRAVGGTPDDTYSKTYLTFIAALAHAQKQALITNAYFVPDPQLLEALISAAKRGVEVKLLLSSTTDSRSAALAAHAFYQQLLEGGVKIFERHGALLHAKTAVIDGVWSTVGSANLDWRSAVDNDELNAVIVSRDFAKQMQETFAHDQSESQEITLEAWQHRPFRERFKEWFFKLCGRML